MKNEQEIGVVSRAILGGDDQYLEPADQSNRFAITGILLHLILRFGLRTDPDRAEIPLLATLALGGTPLVCELHRGGIGEIVCRHIDCLD
jgi:hypothetical protein